MFVNMARVKPRPGREGELEANMKQFRDDLRRLPACRGAFVLCEPESGYLVGLSLWVDETAFGEAMKSLSARTPTVSPAELREAPPELRTFVELP